MENILENTQLLFERNNSLLYFQENSIYGKPILYKLLNNEEPSPQELLLLENEYNLLKGVDIPGVRKVLDKVKLNQQEVLVLEYFEGERMKEVIQEKNFSLEAFFDFSIQMAQVLHRIHQKNIIHCDINNNNILVNSNTSEIQLIDFGIASKINIQNKNLKLDHLRGTMAYISPEQTGRMNRSVDTRSDLYSLGVSLYEFVTKQLPFLSSDPMELIHAHIAQVPNAPQEINPQVPDVLSDIILKLLAKDAEQRYQSASGLLADLKQCQKEWQQAGEIIKFDLGQEDYSGKLHLVEKLYGRENELQQLTDTLLNVQKHDKELYWIGGYSGIGKSALVQELKKYLPKSYQGNFLTGKFGQFQKDIPYFAFTQAFNLFCDYLLMLPEDKLDNWRQKIQNIVGSNGQLMIDIIPHLKKIIGKQPKIGTVNDLEAQNRFNLLFQDFIALISQEYGLLVLFLDDLQWADGASLRLIKNLMTFPKVFPLLLITAYRDNEVDTTNPMVLLQKELVETTLVQHQLTLQNLQKEDIQHLIIDSLKIKNKQEVHELSNLIFQKTQGNPFFSNSLLQNIYEQGFLSFNFQEKTWQWDMQAIQIASFSDNVLDLMTEKLTQLRPEAQSTLQKAACLGNQFDLKSLLRIHEGDIQSLLWDVIEAGLLLPLSEDYKLLQGNNINISQINKLTIIFQFSHDRVQQAAYEQLEETEAKKTHLQIARLLSPENIESVPEEDIFEIVRHYNKAITLLVNKQEKDSLVRLNQKAGLKAKASTAYQTALNYFNLAISLLSEDTWETNYQLSFALYLEKTNLEFLLGNTEASHDLILILEEKVQSVFETAILNYIRSSQGLLHGNLQDAVLWGSSTLKLLDLETLSENKDIFPVISQEYQISIELLKNKKLEDLSDESNINSLTEDLIADTLYLLGISYLLSGNVMAAAWTTFKGTNRILTVGSNRLSSYFYTQYGSTCILIFKNFEQGISFGKLGKALSEKENNLSNRTRVYHSYVVYINYYTKHLKEGVHLEKKAIQFGLEGGELQFTSFAAYQVGQDSLMIGVNLNKLLEDCDSLTEIIQRTNPVLLEHSFIPSVLQPLLNLLGETNTFESFDTDNFEELVFLENYAQEVNALSTYYVAKLRSLYLFDFFEEAFALVPKYEMIAQTLIGLIGIPEAAFYVSLTITTYYEQITKEEKEQYLQMLETLQQEMKERANRCSDNFLHKYLLVEAERKRLDNKSWEAIQFYQDAIQATKDADYQNIEAVANECFARFWLSLENANYASFHLRRAYYLYEFWGAKGKIRQLAEKYPRLLRRKSGEVTLSLGDTTGSTKGTETSISTATGSFNFSVSKTSRSSDLDFFSVVKASQALSQALNIDILLQRILAIAIENAGAELGYVIDERDDKLYLHERQEQQTDSILIPINQKENQLPLSIINYVRRTREELVLSDASKQERYRNDPYIRTQKPRSVLCFPVVRQGKVSIIIYLENNLTEGAFTVERLTVLRTLSSQMAISIENALLYENLETKVKERTKELKLKNDNITASITAAQRIQEATINYQNSIKEYFPDSFIIYQPRDIVSGDFYWFYKRLGSALIAVVDCTGHGVPGAFMSLLGNTSLNEIIQDNNLTTAEILQSLKVKIENMFANSSSQSNVGMVLSLCEIQYNENESVNLTFAGAKQSIFYFQQASEELKELKGNRISIGSVVEYKSRQFQNQEVTLQKGDIVYLFSDGLPDTVNSKRKRYGLKNIKKLILTNYKKSLQEQKYLFLEDMDIFRQNTPARDDLTFLGIRV